MEAIEELYRALARVKQLASDQRLTIGDGPIHRIVELEIELLAVEMTVGRAAENWRDILDIRSKELDKRISRLAFELLGYYALPVEPGGIGQNEPPIGPAHAKRARAEYSRTIRHGTADDRKAVLARKLGVDK